jgi:hypothetical protein
MNRIAVLRVLVIAVAWGLVASMPSLADDSAAAIAAGGLVPRHETRIVMAREVLQISLKKVVVDYDFRNDTDKDVTTEMAFPIPPYKNGYSSEIQEDSFQSFRLWVDGKPVKYESEVKATLEDKDVTALLLANHIDISTFGHFDDSVDANHEEHIIVHDFSRLSKATQSQLIKEGLFDDQDDQRIFGNWTVHLQYHWTQTFPAHSTVHIRHEYTPVVGFEDMPRETIDLYLMPMKDRSAAKFEYPPTPEDLKLLDSFCPALSMLHGIQQRLDADASKAEHLALPQWVDFILTSANTWKRPIEDFTLIVERPKPEHGGKIFISFCSPANGTVEKLDADHLQVHLTNFVPTSELHIGFFEVPLAKAAHPAAKK